VDRGAEKQLQSLFDELILKVDAPLNAAREAGKTGRLALIDDIRTRLDASSDAEIPQLIETVKAAQTRWKALPQTWRKDDRKLWLQFRALCDQCFERRDAVLAGKRDSQRQLGQILNA